MTHKSDSRAARSQDVDVDEPVREQVRNGSCNLVPFPRDLPTVPFRTELFSESLPTFVSNSYRRESWEWERSTTLPDLLKVELVESADKSHFVLRAWRVAPPKKTLDI